MVLGGENFGWFLDHEGGAFMKEINAIINITIESSPDLVRKCVSTLKKQSSMNQGEDSYQISKVSMF